MVPPLVRADFITGLAIVALGGAALVLSLEMPRFEDREIDPYTIPGLVPAILGGILLALGLVLTVRAARAGGWRFGPGSAWGADDRPTALRVALTIALTVGYAAGLVGLLPFWLATFLFALAFVVVFEWAKGAEGRVRRIAFAVLYATALAAAVTYVFQEIFLVRLP